MLLSAQPEGEAEAASADTTTVGLSVIVPAYNAGATLRSCLAALRQSADADTEIIVVDDGSTEDLAGICRPFDVRFVRLLRNRGRGPARNAGVAVSAGRWLLFVDADVVLRPDSLAQVRQVIAAQSATAFFGSYDDAPGAPNLASQYRNLLHHFTHQRAGRMARHFWTGFGAVRRDVFRDVGGFDEGRWARNMEEVDFGSRLTAAGIGIRVVPDLLATHLKRDTLWSMARTDLLHRALPWSRMILEDRRGASEFVTSHAQRLSVAGAGLLVTGLLLAPLTGAGLLVAGLGAVGFAGANFRFWRFLQRRRGAMFAARCAPLHLVHALCAGTGFAVALTLLGRRAALALLGNEPAPRDLAKLAPSRDGPG